MPLHEFRTIQNCPVPKLIAPFVAICVNDAKATVNSIYRGTDAEWILNKHGKHSQAQLYAGWIRREPGFLPANPPGRSTHELKSDHVAYPIPPGHDLAWWMQGFDVNDSDVERVEAVARKHGWSLFRPYPSGNEYHHLNFRAQPVPHGLADRLRVVRLRATLPRS